MEQFLAGEPGHEQNLPDVRCLPVAPAAPKGEARGARFAPRVRRTNARHGAGRTAGPQPPHSPNPDDSGTTYDEVFRRVETTLQGAREHISRELSLAGAQWQRLKSHPQARRLVMIFNDRRLQTWGLFELLLDQARPQAERNPALGHELAQLALAIAERLPAETYGSERMADFRCAALTELANARRLSGNLTGARIALGQAKVYLDFGSGDLLDKANLAQRQFELLRDLGDLEAAATALDQARVLFRMLGDDRLRGVTVLPRGGSPKPGSSPAHAGRRAQLPVA
jgi:hypothetical protein